MDEINLYANPTTEQDCMTAQGQDCRTDLTDITFLVPLRIDSTERKENADTLIKYTYRHFNTSFIILEADTARKYFPVYEPEGFHFEFVEDTNEVFHRTKWINRLISMTDTPYVAVWDADAIAPPEQVLEAVNKLRTGDVVMSFPYDGRFYSCDNISADIFKQILNIEILIRRIPVMRLFYGYHSVGGAFIVNKEEYLNSGGENENFYGWGLEDCERVKRMEILNIPVHQSIGSLFHLWHPIGKNSWFADRNVEIRSRKEFLKTCSINS